MEFVGIIAEYDPFHNGHAAQLAELRRRGAKTIAVCLSAGLTQRGAIPLLPERPRVEAALLAGADLVVALPAPYACAGAEAFAAAGVHLLTALGCDTLAFGAETPSAERLMAVAALLQSPAFAAALPGPLAGGATFAAARAAAAETLLPGAAELLRSPNNILGIEYGKAILSQQSPMVPLPLPRLGAGHGAAAPGTAPDGTAMASASWIRANFAQLTAKEATPTAPLPALAPYLPPAALPLYRAAAARGELADRHAFSVAVLACLRTKTAVQLAETRGLAEGLEHRLAAAIAKAGTVEELYALLKTKRYPHARLRRLVLDAALGFTEAATLPPLPPYLQVLGARRAALPLLAGATLPASTSLAELARTGADAKRVSALHSTATDFSALCREKPMPGGLAFTAKPVLL